MRIVIVAPEQIPVPPVRGGSVEICITAIARELAQRHRVTIISRRYPRYPNRTVQGRLTIVRVPTGSPGRYLGHVKNELRRHNFDMIQVDNRPRFVRPIKRLFPDKPVSLFMHSLTFVSAPYVRPKTAAACLTHTDVIVANSSSLQKQLTRRFPQVAERIRKVWLGVDTARFKPATAAQRDAERRKYGLAGRFTVLYAGRLIPRKGIPVLMRAVRLASARGKRAIGLVIAGGAQRKAYGTSLRRLAKKLRLRVRFLGTVPHRRMHRIYRLADCFVCPSQGHEAFGLVNVEAMASGVPVIAANNGGVKEIIDHCKSGLLVQSYRSPEGYAAAIVKLMKSPGSAARLARRGRLASVRRFGWAVTACKLEQLYSAMATAKKEGGRQRGKAETTQVYSEQMAENESAAP